MFIKRKTGIFGAAVTALLLVSGTAVGMTQAYLTGTPQIISNQIQPGEVKIEVTEEHWDPEKAKGMGPGQTVEKDPAVRNTGSINAWVFLKIGIPVRTIALVDEETGRKQEAKETNLILIRTDSQWKLLEETKEGEYQYQVYGYQKAIAPQETTSPLFQTFTIVPYLEGELSEKEAFQIPVDAFALQNTAAAADSDLSEIYQIYLKQRAAEKGGEI